MANKTLIRTEVFKKIPKNLVEWFENLIEDTNCKIEIKIWQSDELSYVRYNYKPFCADGYSIEITVSGEYNHMDFVKQLYAKRIANIEHLQRSMKAEYKPTLLEKFEMVKR
jgi:hypothetical protein